MKPVLSILFCFLFTVCRSQPGPKHGSSTRIRKHFNEICIIIKSNGLYADSVNWTDLDQKITLLSENIRGFEDFKPIHDTIVAALRKAGDIHSFILSKEDAQKNMQDTTTKGIVEGMFLGDGIGYIKVPTFVSLNLLNSGGFAEKIQSAIRELDQNYSISSWIVDLRENGGGNMHPMIKGLSCLIGQDVCGYVVYPRKKKDMAISPVSGGMGWIKLSSYKLKTMPSRIAVLIDAKTGSSGEFTAIAFKSFPGTRFFGQPSAGYTTVNHSFPLSDGSWLFLAAGYMADSNHKTYLPNILPDVYTEPATKGGSDSAIIAAKKWLKEN